MKLVEEKHNAVLKPIVKMFENLETIGIEVEFEDETKEIIRGSIANLSGDNLGIHQMTGKLLKDNLKTRASLDQILMKMT